MADLALDYFLDDNDNDTHEPQEDETPIEKQKPHENERNDLNPEVEENPLQLLRSLYQRDEEIRQKRQENKREKIKLKSGCIVDVFSSSKQQWTQGMVLRIHGDTLCVVYGSKKKWLHKSSPNLRVKPVVENPNDMVSISPRQSLSPPAAYSSPVVMDDPSVYASSPSFAYSSSNDSAKSASNRNALFATYDVVFDSELLGNLGLSFSGDEDGMNCVVTECLNDFAVNAVQCGSMVAAVNGKHVMDLPHTVIMDVIQQNALMPPLIMTFRKCDRAVNAANHVLHRVEEEEAVQEPRRNNMDVLELRNNMDIRHLIENEGALNERVICSQKIKKVNHRGKTQERILVITNRALYYLKYIKKSQRRIRIRDIGMMTVGCMSDEFVVHVPSQYDAHFIAKNKHEIARLLQELHFKETSNNLIVMESSMRRLNDIVLTKKLSMIENRTAKVSMQRSISTMMDVLEEIEQNE